MNVITVESKETAADYVHVIMEEHLVAGKLNVLGLATGSTMIPVYKKWVESNISFENVTVFNLDEYVGLTADNKNSYAYFMNEHLFERKKFKQTFIPNGSATDLEEECKAYEALLREHSLDIQFLGLGENGHIAFNEPEIPFDSETHVAYLTESTLGANNRFFDNKEEIPTVALTMGIASILAAKKIILIVFGEKKRFALEKLMEGEVSEDYPVTSLLNHEDVTVITDIQDLPKCPPNK